MFSLKRCEIVAEYFILKLLVLIGPRSYPRRHRRNRLRVGMPNNYFPLYFIVSQVQSAVDFMVLVYMRILDAEGAVRCFICQERLKNAWCRCTDYVVGFIK